MKLIRCDTWYKKIFGLMFRFFSDGAVFINNKSVRYNLHTFFVFYPIDILFLDENFKIIKIYKKVKPFNPYIKGVKSKYIIELKNSDYKLGDKINVYELF